MDNRGEMSIAFIGYIIGLIGMWIFSDAIFSWTVYLHAPSYEGSPKQTFWRDHWVRLARMIASLILMWIGGLLLRIW